MRCKFIILLLTFFLLSESHTSFAGYKPRRPKSCPQKVLLPGHSKPVKCSKARKMKNNYF
jgi:hypothetical protein